MSTPLKVLLFDIDLTLLFSGHAGTRAINRTFFELYRIEEAHHEVSPDGKTDPLIFREIFQKRLPHLVPDAEMAGVADRYLVHLEWELDHSQGFVLMPGVVSLLDTFSKVSSFSLGIATGNLERGACLKLKRGGLDSYFGYGGFGSDAEDRAELIRVAACRAEAILGNPVPNEHVFVIGDTPLDIHNARRAGVRSVGVCTGRWDRNELALHGPDHLFDDLSHTEEVLEFFMGA